MLPYEVQFFPCLVGRDALIPPIKCIGIGGRFVNRPYDAKNKNKFEVFTIAVGNAVLGVPIKSPQTYNYDF